MKWKNIPIVIPFVYTKSYGNYYGASVGFTNDIEKNFYGFNFNLVHSEVMGDFYGAIFFFLKGGSDFCEEVGTKVEGNFYGINFNLTSTEVKNIYGASFSLLGPIPSKASQNSGGGNKINKNSYGILISGFLNSVEGTSYGVNIAGLLGNVMFDFYGVNIAGCLNDVDNSYGINIAGIANLSRSNSLGAQISLFYNKSKSVDRFLFQFGLVNKIGVISENATALQIGIYNKIEGKIIPLINFKFGNFLQKRKKDQSLEDLL